MIAYILFRLIEMHGRKWKSIADELDRTPINVRDKYKSMGEEANSLRQKDYWTMGELIKMIRLIEKRVKSQLVDLSITEEFLQEKIQESDEVIYMDASKKRKHSYSFDKKLVKLL